MGYAAINWKTVMISALLAVSLTACGGTKSGTEAPVTSAPAATADASTPAPVSKYPEKSIIMVAPSGAGGGWDKTARSIVKVLGETKLVDQTMTVENKPGGGGIVFLSEYVTKDKSNPYKLFVSSPPILINNLKKEGNSPFGYKDTTPLAQLTKDYGAIAVNANSKYNDLKSLVEAIKADPKKITLAGGSAPGSMDHLIGILPAFKFGVDPKSIKYISYDGGGEAIAALLGNNADVIGTDISSLGSYLKAGKIKILAITSPTRLGGDFKDVPTLKEQGIDADFTIWRGVLGPKEMKADEIAYWDAKLKTLSENEVWNTELKANDWLNEYKNSTDFKKFLEVQEIVVQEMLTALGMQK
jgi:putative tricarboxylic transport membrane protein